MALTQAPYHDDVCLGDTPGQAYWAKTSDGLRVRLGHWTPDAPKGTVLLYPGRTEYIEKYSTSADELAKRGYATFAIDWRGQGLADRMLENPRVGHVVSFDDYQIDVTAMLAAAEELDLPKPFYLLGHSMGGCIALRSVMEGLEVKAVAFSGPMWGIRIDLHLQPVAWVVKQLFPALGFGHVTPPTTVPEPYVLNAAFNDNLLTRDAQMWENMREQIATHRDLSLGGPSIIWLREALAECDALNRRPSPDLPCVTYLGSNERIVHVGRIRDRMSRWKGARLDLIQNAEHEVMMDSAAIRTRIFDDMAQFFEAA